MNQSFANHLLITYYGFYKQLISWLRIHVFSVILIWSGLQGPALLLLQCLQCLQLWIFFCSFSLGSTNNKELLQIILAPLILLNSFYPLRVWRAQHFSTSKRVLGPKDWAIFSSSTTPFNQLVKPISINHRKCKFNFRKLHSTPCYPGTSQVVQISNIRHGYLGADYTLSFDHDTALFYW